MKKYALIALVVLFILLVFGIIFYKDRVFFVDPSYILFNILQHKSLQIQEHRYGSFITQIVPYFGLKFHFPINVIITGYAYSFNCFYFIVGLLLFFWFRQYELTILFALYYTLVVSDTFFWTNNEIHQATAWMFLCFGILITMRQKKRNIFLIIIPFLSLAFITIFTHFIVLISFTYLWGWFMIDNKQLKFPWYLYAMLTSLLAVIILLKFNVVSHNSYDDISLHGVTHFTIKDIINTFSSFVVLHFISLCFTNYWWALILFFAGMVSLVRDKKYSLAIWTILILLGYIVCMGIAFGATINGRSPLYYIESEWQSVGIIMATPFVFSVLPKLKIQIALPIMILIFATRLVYIGLSSSKFSYRTEFKEKVLAAMRKKGITKLGIIYDEKYMYNYMGDWVLSDESILMSALEKDVPQLTFVFIKNNNVENLKKLINPKAIEIYNDIWYPESWDYEYLSYDTVHSYTIMTYNDLVK